MTKRHHDQHRVSIRSPRCLFLLFLVMAGFTLLRPLPVRPAITAGNLDDVARAVESFFPKVSGTITAVGVEDLQFDIGRASGIQPGLILTVFRPGEAFSHPVTGVVLGRYEQTVAQVEVQQVGEGSSRGIVLTRLAPLQVGDQLRLTAGRIPVVVVPGPSAASRMVAEELAIALSETGRFRPRPLENPGETVAVDPFELARSQEADYLLQADAESVGGDVLFKMSILSRPGRTEIGRMEIRLRPATEGDLTLENLQHHLLLQAR